MVVASNLGMCHLAYRSAGWYFPSESETRVEAGWDDICDGPWPTAISPTPACNDAPL